MRIAADTGVCVGAGQCVLTDPEVFDQDDDGTVVVLAEHPEGEHAAGAHQAVALCPSRALTLVAD
ncbi:ferredoxin [Streptomonospora wellingtoniae]|uniref:(4Fe-4S)-binding protein n=1 Tax=Streptomonospora wellingtoniae TaxID=3075544 RepID=A0ABU2L0X3_9ACTN|nr:(4Fe-4S)-binding protein [Streptomonospora sp. DSM 45055]MDT0305206.1 (4Fe-4S)-binding protein [Streptomonospora sp. DSM 45055]